MAGIRFIHLALPVIDALSGRKRGALLVEHRDQSTCAELKIPSGPGYVNGES
jgi:hypothetical protein